MSLLNGEACWAYNEEQREQCTINVSCFALFLIVQHSLYGNKHRNHKIKSNFLCSVIYFIKSSTGFFKEGNMQYYIHVIGLNNVLQDYNTEMCLLVTLTQFLSVPCHSYVLIIASCTYYDINKIW